MNWTERSGLQRHRITFDTASCWREISTDTVPLPLHTVYIVVVCIHESVVLANLFLPLHPTHRLPDSSVSTMASLAFYLSASVLFAQSTVAFNCSKPPVYVDIHKRAVHDSATFQYGSFIGVGSPAQNQSLWPSLSRNHTSFGSHSYCDNSTLKDCQTSTGGFFNPQDSETLVTFLSEI